MKKIVFVFFALFLLMFSSCRTLSYTETEVTPSSDAYIGLLCDPNNSVHCFTIESVESYLDTFFSDKKIMGERSNAAENEIIGTQRFEALRFRVR